MSLARSIVIGGLAGFVAGLIAGGIGSRIAMRISAIAAGDRFQGRETEFGANVGEITAGGTIELVFFGGFVGVYGGVIYMAMRRWLADAGSWKGLAFGGLLLAILGSAIIHSNNPDFHLFGPPALNITMFALIFLAFGLVVPPLAESLCRTLPQAEFHRSAIPFWVAAAFAIFPLLFALPVTAIIAEGEAPGGVPVGVVILPYVLVVMPIASILIRRSAGRFDRLSDLRVHPRAMAAALAVLAAPIIAGIVFDVVTVREIYEANF